MIGVKEKLQRRDKNKLVKDYKEIYLFSVVRNESLRLPFLFEFYRKMGVTRFFIVDNGSIDSTINFLLAQKDTHVFYTESGFKNREIWLNDLLDLYGIGNWCLTIDADELFIYPDYENIKIKDFCEEINLKGYTAIESILIDMYSEKRIVDNKYLAGDDLIKNSPYFDPYCYIKKKQKMTHVYTNDEYTADLYFGGTRKRVFGMGVCCSKIALHKHDKGIYLDRGNHSIIGAQISPMRCAVLHFKFLYDFIPKAYEEANREEHFSNAKEYKIYAIRFMKKTVNSAYYEQSIKYENSQQLINLRFIKEQSEREE